MAYEQKPNTGALFKNEKRETEKHPTHKGSCVIDEREYWISAWVNESKAGKKYFGLSFQLKDEQTKQKAPDLDDSIPF